MKNILFLFFFLASSAVPLQAQVLSFEFQDVQVHEQKLLDILTELNVFDTLTRFTEENIHLKTDAVVRFYNGDGLLFDAENNLVLIPYAYVTQVYKGLESRYPQQDSLRRNIFASAIEQFLWFELGRVLVSQYALPISGKEELVLDEFAILMLLNFSSLAEDYIIDGVEAYLIVDDARSLLDGDNYQNEADSDKARYQQAVCLVLGNDYEPYPWMLSDIMWNSERLARCRADYQAKLKAWYELLKPYLGDKSELEVLVKDEVKLETP